MGKIRETKEIDIEFMSVKDLITALEPLAKLNAEIYDTSDCGTVRFKYDRDETEEERQRLERAVSVRDRENLAIRKAKYEELKKEFG